MIRIPPEQLLEWQPRSAADFTRLEAMLRDPAQAPGGETPRALDRAATVPAGSPAWSEIGPPARAGHFLVLDSRRHRLLMVGGLGQYDPAGTIWSRDLPSGAWTPLATLPSVDANPYAFDVTAAAYDSLRDQLLVVPAGGSLALEALPLSGSPTWSELWTGPSVPIAAIAVDTRRDQVVFLGAWDTFASAHRIIRVPLTDPGSWSSDPVAGDGPGFPRGGSAVYDPMRDAFDVVVEEGFPPSEVGRLFTLAADGPPTWIADPAPELAAPFGDGGTLVAVARDAASDRLILTSSTGSALALPTGSGTAQWLTRTADQRFRSAIAFDPASRRLFRDGGSSAADPAMPTIPGPTSLSASVDSGVTWTTAQPPSAGVASWIPDAGSVLASHWLHQVLLDPDSQQLLTFGWLAFDHRASGIMARPVRTSLGWAPLGADAAGPPAGSVLQAAALSPGDHALLWYGGQASDGTGTLSSDLWRLALMPGGRWSRVATSGPSPGNRRGSSLIRDAVRGRFVLVGGDDGANMLTDAWELRLAPSPSWRPLAVGGTVPTYSAMFSDDSRGDAFAVSYPVRIRHVRLEADSVVFEDMGSTGMALPGSSRSLPVLAGFDPSRRRLLWFPDSRHSGGYSFPFDEVWVSSLGATVADWSSLAVPGATPFPRGGMGMTIDTDASRIVLDGGNADNGAYFDDTWALQMPVEVPTAAVASLAEATADARGVHLRWQLGATTGARCTVERSADALAWTAAGSANWSGAHEVRFDGAPLAAGTAEAYRVRVAAAGGETVSAAVWLHGPSAAPALAISPLGNPCRGVPALRWTLGADAPAHVRLLDLGGRVISESNVHGSSGEWSSPSRVRPGLYFAELTQRTERRVARIVVRP